MITRLPIAPLFALSLACGGGSGGIDPVTLPPVATVGITPANPFVQLGGTVSLTATLKDAQGVTLTGRTATWSTSDAAIVSVSTGGVVTGHAVGSATISATSEGKTGSVTATIPPVSTVVVTGATSVVVGIDAQLTVTMRDAAGTVLTGRTVTWTTSSSAVLTVSPAGVVHGVAEGSATVTASAEGKSGTLSITVHAAPPAARWLHGMVYDEARTTILLFGGSSQAGASEVFFNDLWSWDGATWTKVATPVAPAGRDGMLFVYDAGRQRVVMFGGRNAQGPLADTWEWDGSAWSQRATTGPAGRLHFGGGFDRARSRTVLYGGQTVTNVPLTDTWEWDGATWTQRATTRPTALDAPSHPVFDAGRNALLMFIGGFSTGATEMWQWSGTAWSVIASGPTMSSPHVMASLGPANILMYNSDGPTASTWRWNGTAWSNLSITSPPRRFGAALAFDPLRNQVVQFGGFDGSSFFNDTRVFAGNAWTLIP